MEIPEEGRVTGVQVGYNLICKRKLWLFSNQINMEQASESVKLGKLVHEESYLRKKKEIGIGSIKIDFVSNKCEVHEVKKSRKMKKSDEYQLLYYLFYLKQKGIAAKGSINYPLLRQKIEVELTAEKEKELDGILADIINTVVMKEPPKPVKLPYCKSCSYYNFCWC